MARPWRGVCATLALLLPGVSGLMPGTTPWASASPAPAISATWWTLAGQGNTSTDFTVSKTVRVYDPTAARMFPESAPTPGSAYVGYAIERASDRTLLYAQIRPLAGAFTATSLWMDNGGPHVVDLHPGARYRLLLLSDRPQLLTFPVSGTADERAFVASSPVRVGAAERDTPSPERAGRPGHRSWEHTPLAGKGGTFGFAAAWANWTAATSFGADVCITRIPQICKPGFEIDLSGGPGYGGTWSFAPKRKLPKAQRQVSAVFQGDAAYADVTILGLIVH